jgi:peptidoglycan/LPS O-acetylase OafA/YrhL
MNSTKPYFPALTGVRAVAAFMVLIHHFNFFRAETFGVPVHNFTSELHVGVTIFFVLSGLLIGYRYIGLKRIPLRSYFANRFARIYPMYFLLTTLTYGVLWQTKEQSGQELIKEYLLNLTFLRGLFEQYLYTGISQGWSLTVEEMFYLSAPLAFWLIQRSWHWLWRFPLLLLALGCMLVLVARHQPWDGFFSSFDFLFQYVYFGRVGEFFVGITLAWLLRRYPAGTTTPRFITWAGVTGIMGCVGVLALLHGPQEFDFGVLTPTGMAVNNLVLPVFGIAPLLWGLMREKTILQQLLSSRLLVLLGKSSYVFYLIHMGVMRQFLRGLLPNTVFCVLALYLISIGLYAWAEEPLNTWLRRVLGRPAAASAEEALVQAPPPGQRTA